MRALKALVAGLGVLIVGGMGLLVYSLYMKASDPDFTIFRDGAAQVAPAKHFGRVELSLPKGCAIVDMRPDGARLYLHVGPPIKSCERIIIIDTTNGAIVGAIEVGP